MVHLFHTHRLLGQQPGTTILIYSSTVATGVATALSAVESFAKNGAALEKEMKATDSRMRFYSLQETRVQCGQKTPTWKAWLVDTCRLRPTNVIYGD